MQEISKYWKNSIIIQAEHRDFRGYETFRYPQVQSCFILHCMSGSGRITVNQIDYDVSANTIIFAPWNHSIHYHPDTENPFTISGVHLIPETLESGDIRFNAFHSNVGAHPLYQLRHNQVTDRLNRSCSIAGSGKIHLINMINYAIELYKTQATEEQLRLQARLLFFEIYKMIAEADSSVHRQYPVVLQRMLNHIEDYIELPIFIKHLEFHSQMSSASIFRIFRKYFDTTPQKYIISRRLAHAAEVLKNSTVSIAALSRCCQFSTPANFCRAFKKKYGISPKKFREEPGGFPENEKFVRPPRKVDGGLTGEFRPR